MVWELCLGLDCDNQQLWTFIFILSHCCFYLHLVTLLLLSLSYHIVAYILRACTLNGQWSHILCCELTSVSSHLPSLLHLLSCSPTLRQLPRSLPDGLPMADGPNGRMVPPPPPLSHTWLQPPLILTQVTKPASQSCVTLLILCLQIGCALMLREA